MTTTAIAPVASATAVTIARREAGLRSLSAEARHRTPLPPPDRRRQMALASFDRTGRSGRGPGLVLRPRDGV